MDISRIISRFFLSEPNYAFEILQDSHTQFTFQGFKNYPSTERFPDDFGLNICETKSHSVTYEFLQPFE